MKTIWITTAVCVITLQTFAAESVDTAFDSDGTEIRYTIEGAGEPVLLIHGYRASGDLNWRLPGVNKTLAPHFQVITIDNRGHGKSGSPTDDRYGIEMVNDSVRLLDHLGIESAHVVGYSMGGMIAIKLSVLHPERVRSAVVGGMGWYEETPVPANEPEPTEHFEIVARGFRELATTEAEMTALDVPMVAIIGTDDGLTRRVDRWLEVTPELPVVYIEGANHNGCMFKPEFKEAVLTFLQTQSGGGR